MHGFEGARLLLRLRAFAFALALAARANGVPVEYIVFEDEGHGFRKKENRAEGYEAILEFLNQHLRNVPQPVAG